MAALLVIDTTVHDPKVYKQYTTAARPIIEAHGGEYLARSEKITPLSGGWEPTRMVIIRFPDMERLQACFGCDDYAAIKHLREASCAGKAVIVEDED